MFLIVVANYWGRGETIDIAKKQVKKESGKTVGKKTPKVVFQYDPTKTPQCYISELGSLCWEGEKPAEIERVSG